MTYSSFNFNTTANTTTYRISPFILVPDPDAPMLSHQGPVEFSTCADLVVLPQIIWDVNGYYRDLGVDPHATRQEMKRAYLEGDGHSSRRKTYCLKQLLNPQVRYHYDRAPLGSRLIDDYVFDEAKRKAKRDMAQRRQSQDDDQAFLRAMEENGIPRRVVGLQQDYLDDTPDDTSEEVVDDDPDEVQDEAFAREPEVVAPRVYPWTYAFYLWRTNCRDTQRLSEWQEMLATAFRERGLILRLAVGYHGRSQHPWVTAKVGYRLVVFLHESEQPTAEAARAVADRVVQDMQPARNLLR